MIPGCQDPDTFHRYCIHFCMPHAEAGRKCAFILEGLCHDFLIAGLKFSGRALDSSQVKLSLRLLLTWGV
jgi:hypothetical protein